MTISISDKPEDLIREEATALGFDACGFASVAEAWPASARLAQFVSEGLHGTMQWMETTAERRAHPRAMWPDARSAVVLGLSYGPDSNPLVALTNRDRGAISVYAQGDDYHDLIKKRLKRLAGWMQQRFGGEVKVFVDTAPLMEKPLAEAAGLGWQGKHTNLVSREHGSWLFLGSVLTTLALRPDPPVGEHCGSCQACLDICPTNAFPAPFRLDARRCISYLTIEHAGPIPEEFRAALGNRIYGCDDCLAVCPWNKFAVIARESAFHARDTLRSPRLADLAALDDPAFRALFSKSPVKRLGRDRFVRNVLYAIGNSGDATLIPTAEALLGDPSDVVRDAAGWALAQLKPFPLEGGRELSSQHLRQPLKELDGAVAEVGHGPSQAAGGEDIDPLRMVKRSEGRYGGGAMILTLSCPDQPGIVSRVSTFLFERGCNILDAQQYDDEQTNQFFMRVVFDPDGADRGALRGEFEALATSLSMTWTLRDRAQRYRVMLLASQADHCLADLLYRWRIEEMPMELTAVVSNHPAETFEHLDLSDVAFHHLPVTKDTKLEQEAALWKLIRETKTDIVVLARYMQVLSEGLAAKLEGRCINIHHSFLPGFKGARPYHQAHARGVKVIGATAHYVTGDLDEGPIIEQDVERISHRDSPENLVRKGRDIERRVLARALRWRLEDRVLLNGRKTVVFTD